MGQEHEKVLARWSGSGFLVRLWSWNARLRLEGLIQGDSLARQIAAGGQRSLVPHGMVFSTGSLECLLTLWLASPRVSDEREAVERKLAVPFMTWHGKTCSVISTVFYWLHSRPPCKWKGATQGHEYQEVRIAGTVLEAGYHTPVMTAQLYLWDSS